MGLFVSSQVNRLILLEEDRVKAETESAKAPVDFATLQLHNLLYEKNHYLKAIKACKDFRSKYPDIELVPEEEFVRDAPDDIRGGVLSSDGAHDLMLKRLNYELHQVCVIYTVVMSGVLAVFLFYSPNSFPVARSLSLSAKLITWFLTGGIDDQISFHLI